MKLPFQIAIRFLKSSRGQTILIVLGIAVGVSVQIFIGSLIQGLQKSLIDKTIGNSPHITISSNVDDNTILDYKELTNQIGKSDGGIINVSAVTDGPALIQEGDKNYSVLVRGMNIEDSDKIYNIKERIYEGKEPTGENEVIIGRELQEELQVTIGDEIEVLAGSGQNEKLKVTGFYDLKVASLNKSWVITTLETSQNVLSLDNKVTGIETQVKDIFEADVVAGQLATILPSNVQVDNWKDQNAELLSGLNGQSVSSIMIQVFVLVAVVLGIASVLAITVVQKSKQIGILKAMGIKDKTASLIFLFQGFLLGIMGAIVGICFGLLLSFMFTKFALNPDGSPVVALYIDYKFIGISAVIAVASATVASLIPARHSLKLNPIEVIKNG